MKIFETGRYWIALLLFSNSLVAGAQQIDTAFRFEPIGNQIRIEYNILNSTPDQQFKVTIVCICNDANEVPLEHATGDIGDGVKGGKSRYQVTWDVLEDVEQLESAEFVFYLEPMEPQQTPKRISAASNAKDLSWNAMLAGGIRYTPLGLRLAYISNWGLYLQSRMGFNGYYWEHGNYHGNELLYDASAGLSRRLYQNPSFDIHGYVGSGIANWGYYEYKKVELVNNGGNMSTEEFYYEGTNNSGGYLLEYGALIQYKRISAMIGMAHRLKGTEPGNDQDYLFGIGYSF